MKKPILLLAIVTVVIIAVSCHKAQESWTGGEVYLDMPDTTTLYFETSSSTYERNRWAQLGRVLFYDRHLSLNNSVSCASCHRQELGFADNTAFSRGFENRLTGRNSPGIANVGS